MRSWTLFAVLFLIAAGARAAEPQIHNLTALAAGNRVSVRFVLANGFNDPELVKRLQSGLPTRFEYTIEIYRDRPWWIDQGVSRSRIEVEATFNSITREYTLAHRRDRLLVRTETFNDLDAVERRMASIDEPGLFDIGRRRANKLHVRVRAEFGRTFLLYVIPSAVATDWRDVRVATPESRP